MPTICHRNDGPTQFYDSAEVCVSSVLSPQGGRSYDPRNLYWGGRDEAWCEGSPGPGVGEVVRLSFEPRIYFRTLLIRNGYQRTIETFRRNGRVAGLEIKAGGVIQRATLADRSGEQRIQLPRAVTATTIELRVLSVHAGERHEDICLTSVSPDLEDADARLAAATTRGPRSSLDDWSFEIDPDIQTIRFSAHAQQGSGTLTGICRSDERAELVMMLEGYKGKALLQNDHAQETVYYEIHSADGELDVFESSLVYNSRAGRWLGSQGLGAPFLDAFAAGRFLRIRNANSKWVLDFGLAGSRRARTALKAICDL